MTKVSHKQVNQHETKKMQKKEIFLKIPPISGLQKNVKMIKNICCILDNTYIKYTNSLTVVYFVHMKHFNFLKTKCRQDTYIHLHTNMF